jgi:dTDP-4-amino-4,6-dideoxygalactose transaminase
MAVPFMRLRPAEDERAVQEAIQRVVSRGWFVLGPEVEAFEQEFAAASGAPHAIGVGTGTDALALILRALGVGAGDEVVTTPLSAAYTALAIMMTGARPVFADIDAVRLTLDPAKAEAAITDRTKAILPVHLYGQAADMAAFVALSTRRAVPLVEDCCQAHLGSCGGQPVGTFGVASAFSFYPTKNLGALGDGGAIVTADRALAERLKRLRNGGQTDRYHHVEPGVNTRLDELQAAILRARLAYLRDWTARRRALAACYRRELKSATVTAVPALDGGHVYHLFVVRAPDRNRLQQHLHAGGIETFIHYPVPIPRQPAFGDQRPADCPIADRVCGEVLSLPLYPDLEEEIVVRIAETVNRFELAGAAHR